MHDEHSWWRLAMVTYSRGEGHTQDDRSATPFSNHKQPQRQLTGSSLQAWLMAAVDFNPNWESVTGCVVRCIYPSGQKKNISCLSKCFKQLCYVFLSRTCSCYWYNCSLSDTKMEVASCCRTPLESRPKWKIRVENILTWHKDALWMPVNCVQFKIYGFPNLR